MPNGWTSEEEVRRACLQEADQLVADKIPYIYSGKDPYVATPPNEDAGLDCSGFVCWIWETLGIVPKGYRFLHNAASLHSRLQSITEAEAQPFDLAFYGTPSGYVDHVMAVVGDGRVVGASGGGADCLTLADARRLGACVHYKASPQYRPDLIGFARSPLSDVLHPDPFPEAA